MKTKITLIFTCTLVLFSLSARAQTKEKKELTRKEHLDILTKHFHNMNDHMWGFVSHVANREQIVRLDKKRRDVAKFFYDEQKKVELIGDYNGDKVIYDALITYITDAKEITKVDYKDLLPHEKEAENSPEALEVFHKELNQVNKKLSNITETFIKIDLAYRKKYFSFNEFDLKKDEKFEELPKNKVEIITEVYATFSPVYVAFMKSKRAEQKLYDAFDVRDTLKCRMFIEELRKVTNENRTTLDNTPQFQSDTMLHYEYEKVLTFHETLMNKTMPALLSGYGKSLEFEQIQRDFQSRDQSKISEDEWDEMEIKTKEANLAFDAYNVEFNNYVDDRNQIYYHFDHGVNHYLEKHIVREK